MAVRSRSFAGMALAAWGAAGLAGLVACEEVPLTALGANIFLQANPPFVAANGGRALVTAFLTEPAGTLVPDGTEVFFFTDLGSIEERVKTVDGIARTFFVSDSRSGTATVWAYSGGPAPAPSAGGGGGGGTSEGSSSGTGNTSIQIVIGSARPDRVVVTANPQRITSSRQSAITANVFDGFGNPVQNVPVIFRVSATPLEETLDSGGAPQFTNSNGQAFDTLRTKALVSGGPKEVTVEASVPTGQSGTVVVGVN